MYMDSTLLVWSILLTDLARVDDGHASMQVI